MDVSCDYCDDGTYWSELDHGDEFPDGYTCGHCDREVPRAARERGD